VQRFLMVLILMVPFEIRDLKYDDPELKTCASKIWFYKHKSICSFGRCSFFSL